MGACHQFVRTATAVNNCTGFAIIPVQSLIASGLMILRANYPDNHVTIAISRGGKGRAATATRPGHIPTVCAVDSRRIGGSNAKSRKNGVTVIVGAERDIGTLIGPIGDCCLEDRATGNLS
jgi:hypothetical protein